MFTSEERPSERCTNIINTSTVSVIENLERVQFDALTVTNPEDHFVTANARIIKKAPFQIKRFEGNIF